MLGPGMVIFGLAAALGASIKALRFAPDRGFAIAAFCVSTLELAAVVWSVVVVLTMGVPPLAAQS